MIFDENEGHFIERAKDRSYSGPDYREFLIKGKKEKFSHKKEDSQDYSVRMGKWTIRCKVRQCNIVMGTIYLEK